MKVMRAAGTVSLAALLFLQPLVAAAQSIGSDPRSLLTPMRAPVSAARGALDSTSRSNVLSCGSPLGIRVHTSGSNRIEGFIARHDSRGIWLARRSAAGTPKWSVEWEAIRQVEFRETRERTSREAFARGFDYGFVAGAGIGLLAIHPLKGDIYAIMPVLGVALVGGLVGGSIGKGRRGQITVWTHCWP